MTRHRILLVSIATGIIIGVAALLIFFMGHPLICTCGYIEFWHGQVLSSGNSQHLTDWYTFSHLIHGLIFFWLLWLFFKRLPISTRFLIAVVVEAAWEVLENSPLIINRYRQTGLSFDYFGDTVINSVCDILAMVLGFWLARRLPVWASITIIIFLELFVAYFIRDNLTLNIIQLIHPFSAISQWQIGG